MCNKRLILPLLLIPSLLFSGVIEKGISFSSNDLQFSKSKGYDLVRLSGCAPTTEIGKPELAVEHLTFVIPPNAEVKGVEVTSTKRFEVAGEFKILPAQYPEPFAIKYKPKPFVKPDPAVYGLSAEFPGVLAEVTHKGTKGGFRLATVVVYPLQYIPTHGKLYLYQHMQVRLHYDEGVVPAEPIWLHKLEYETAAVKRLVVNPEDVERWTPPIKKVDRFEMDDTTFVNPEYAIMTPDAYVSDFAPLRDWKCRKGVPTEIFTLTWILNNYPGANDTVKVRNFIEDYNQNHGTDYFLCVGDWGVFPMKRMYMSTAYDYHISTDFWYADYDGDWYSEAYVGRFSINNSSEIANYINKTLKYERESPSTGFHEKIFMPGYVLWSGYGCPVNDTIALHDPPSWLDAKRYDWIQTLTTQEISDSFNVGFAYTNISAHGEEYRWGGSYYHTSTDADNLTNAPPLTGWVTGICCLIGTIEYASDDCYVEHMMNNTHGGAAAFVGNSDYGYGRIENPGRSEWQCIWFNDELTNNGVYNYCRTVAAANDRCVPYVGDQYVQHCLYAWLPYGDPQMELWTFFPGPMVGSHNSTVPVGPSTFTVTITDSKAPIENARVCVMAKQDPEYQVDYTNASGVVSFNIDPEIANDTLWVTATKADCSPYEGYAIVTTPGVGEEKPQKPLFFGLEHPQPNPAHKNVKISYSIPQDSRVELTVYNSSGQLVARLLDANITAGVHNILWRPNRDNLPAGIYLIRLTAGNETTTRKVVLISR